MTKTLTEEVEAGHARGWKFTLLDGKVPRVKNWQNTDLPIDEVRQWGGNIGLRTGEASGIAVIDIEAETFPARWMFPKTVTVLTGGNGYHLYYQWQPGIRNLCGTLREPLTGQKMPKIDVRGSNGQVVFPGSVHPETKKIYRWLMFRSPDDIAIAPFPMEYLEQPRQQPLTRPRFSGGTNLTAYARKALDAAYQRVARTPEGQRHHLLNATTFDLAGGVGAGWLEKHDVHQAMTAAGLACGLPKAEVDKTVDDAINAGMASPKQMDLQLAHESIPEFTRF